MPEQHTVTAEHTALRAVFPELIWNNYASWTATFSRGNVFARHTIMHIWQQGAGTVGYAFSSTFPHARIAQGLIADTFEKALPIIRVFYEELRRG